jgi:hypothetical protein
MVLRYIILFLFLVCCLRAHAQSKDARDTCMVVLPLKVYYRDNGFHFISNCTIKKFHLDIFDPDGRRVFKTSRLRRDKNSYYIKLRNYHTGKFKWQIRYTMILNGVAVVKETFGKAEFLN